MNKKNKNSFLVDLFNVAPGHPQKLFKHHSSCTIMSKISSRSLPLLTSGIVYRGHYRLLHSHGLTSCKTVNVPWS